MSTFIILFAALLPAVLLFWFVWRQDKKKEPVSWLLRSIVYGMVISIPVIITESVIEQWLFGGDGPGSLFDTTIMAFCEAAIPEETFKLLALWLVVRRNPYFDEHYDGIVYAVCVGLGFATVENISYVFSSGGEWLSVATTRALLAVPGHYAFAVLMGYYYSLYHFTDRSPRTAFCILAVPVLCHGIYDTIALSDLANAYIGGVSSLVLVWFCVKMHRFAKGKMLAMIDKDRQEEDGNWTFTI